MMDSLMIPLWLVESFGPKAQKMIILWNIILFCCFFFIKKQFFLVRLPCTTTHQLGRNYTKIYGLQVKIGLCDFKNLEETCGRRSQVDYISKIRLFSSILNFFLCDFKNWWPKDRRWFYSRMLGGPMPYSHLKSCFLFFFFLSTGAPLVNALKFRVFWHMAKVKVDFTMTPDDDL